MKLSKKIALTVLAGIMGLYFDDTKTYADTPTVTATESSLGSSVSGSVCTPGATAAADAFAAMSYTDAVNAGYYS